MSTISLSNAFIARSAGGSSSRTPLRVGVTGSTAPGNDVTGANSIRPSPCSSSPPLRLRRLVFEGAFKHLTFLSPPSAPLALPLSRHHSPPVLSILGRIRQNMSGSNSRQPPLGMSIPFPTSSTAAPKLPFSAPYLQSKTRGSDRSTAAAEKAPAERSQ